MSVWIGVRLFLSNPDQPLPQPTIAAIGSSADARAGRGVTVRDIACALLRFTPALAIAPESVILMDVTASLRLFGGIRALRAQVRRALAAFDTTDRMPAPDQVWATAAVGATVAVAASGPAAWMLARCGLGGSALTARSLMRALSRVPLDVSPPARPFADWFRELGCATLADLRRLPRVGLKTRCGPALLDWLDRLDDGLARPDGARSHRHRTRSQGDPGGWMPEAGAAQYRWLELPPAFEAGLELPDHVEHAPALQWAVRHLIRQLCDWLADRHLDAAALTLWLGHARHGYAPWAAQPAAAVSLAPDASTQLDIIPGEPSRDPDSLVRLAQERLNRLTLSASVISVHLRAAQLRAAQTPSGDLFPEPGGTPQDHVHLLALLATRLGADHVLVAAPMADHRPEQAACWAPLGQASPKAPAVPGRQRVSGADPAAPISPAQPGRDEPPAALPRPAWLLDTPIPLAMRGHRPFHGTPLRLVSPAERLDCGWQDGHPVTRDYFVAEDDHGVCYWIFQSRVSVRDDTQPRWFLHGLFG